MSAHSARRFPPLALPVLLGILAAIVVAGCATPPPAATPTAPKATYYPAPPDPPRIQHLATFDRAQSLAAPRSGLADFVLGKDKGGDALVRPYGATLVDGKILVADSRAPGIVTFDLLAQRFAVFAGAGPGKMQRPINVTVDADGTRYVTDTGRNQVLVYDREWRFVAAFGEKGEFRPVDTAIIGDALYVVDIQHHQVVVLDKRTGRERSRFGKAGSDAGSLYHPTNIAVGPKGDLFIVETGNFRVSQFTPGGEFVKHFGEAGQSHGRFARPKGIAIDRAGRMYVSDAAFQNVQLFDAAGRVLMSFGEPVDGGEGLNLPAGVSIDYDNVELFRRLAAPGFDVEYLVLVVSQFGPNKVDVFGFGRKRGATYPPDEPPAPAAGK